MKIWQTKPSTQQIQYASAHEVDTVLQQLHGLPPLITVFEIEKLKSQLADAAQGKRFLLQGGDCAESFADWSESNISNKRYT